MGQQASSERQVEFGREPLTSPRELEREWCKLEAAGGASFFTSWQWIGTLLAAVPPARRPALLRGRANGETVALALLGASTCRRRCGMVRSRRLYLNETGDAQFDAVMIEHNDLVAAPCWQQAARRGLVSWFAGMRNKADELQIRGSLRRLPETAVEHLGLRGSETAVPSYSVELCRLQKSGGELCSVLSANARQQLRRANRYFERSGPLNLREAATAAEALAFFGSMKVLHCASWERRGKPHAFAGPFFEPFHRLLIERCFAERGVQLLRACAGDRVVGYLYNFRLGNRIYAYQSGFDDVDRRERPGVVMHALAIRHAFRSGARVYDFMAGHNRLKESFATRCEPMLWQVIQQPRLAFRLEDLARRAKHAFAGRDQPAPAAGHRLAYR